MELKAPNFYEFAGILVPGTLLLVAIGWLFEPTKIEPLLLPEGFGSLGVLLILAYITGHLLQAIGNGIEYVFWRPQGGMPTSWPVTRPDLNRFPFAIDSVCGITKQKLPDNGHNKERLKTWTRLVEQARSVLYSEEIASRLQVFNGNYGLFRGTLTSFIVIALIGWRSIHVNTITLYIALIGLILLSGYRMHRFGVHYATELFANVAAINEKLKSENDSEDGST